MIISKLGLLKDEKAHTIKNYLQGTITMAAFFRH
jgi:hypothetical protein